MLEAKAPTITVAAGTAKVKSAQADDGGLQLPDCVLSAAVGRHCAASGTVTSNDPAEARTDNLQRRLFVGEMQYVLIHSVGETK
jgi:hypothetical protein